MRRSSDTLSCPGGASRWPCMCVFMVLLRVLGRVAIESPLWPPVRSSGTAEALPELASTRYQVLREFAT